MTMAHWLSSRNLALLALKKIAVITPADNDIDTLFSVLYRDTLDMENQSRNTTSVLPIAKTAPYVRRTLSVALFLKKSYSAEPAGSHSVCDAV